MPPPIFPSCPAKATSNEDQNSTHWLFKVVWNPQIKGSLLIKYHECQKRANSLVSHFMTEILLLLPPHPHSMLHQSCSSHWDFFFFLFFSLMELGKMLRKLLGHFYLFEAHRCCLCVCMCVCVHMYIFFSLWTRVPWAIEFGNMKKSRVCSKRVTQRLLVKSLDWYSGSKPISLAVLVS